MKSNVGTTAKKPGEPPFQTHLRVLRPALALAPHGPPVHEEPPRQVQVRGGGHLASEDVQ